MRGISLWDCLGYISGSFVGSEVQLCFKLVGRDYVIFFFIKDSFETNQ
jgi:hypothetical protein